MKKRTGNNEGIWKGVFSIIIGATMVGWPGLMPPTIVVVLGVALLVLGAVLLIGYFRRKRAGTPARAPLAAIVCLLFGLAMVIMPQLFVNILMVVFGILLVLAGLDQLLTLYLARRAGVPVAYFFFIAPVLVLLIGFYIMFSPAISAQTFIILFGVTAIVYGIVTLYNAYMLNQSVKTVKAIEIHEEESV